MQSNVWLHMTICYVRMKHREVKKMNNNVTKKKNDLILMIIVIISASIIFLVIHLFMGNDASTVTIKVDGEVKGTYSLLQNQEIEINNGTNILVIKDGVADMIEADCPDKLCVKQKAISKNKESIICLPNKVIIEVQNGENREYDTMTN